jgi:two-component system sensor histidine kinase VicK
MPTSKHLLYLTDRTSMLLFTFDLTDGAFTFMNPACTTFFDLERTDVPVSKLLNMVAEDDQPYLISKFDGFILGENIENVEFRVRRGKYERWLRVTPYLVTEEGKQVIVGQAEDITNSKATLDLLNNHNIKKNSILTILAHDLAGPIGTVQNLATLLDRETVDLNNPRIGHLISLINKISKSNIHLIRNFLDQEFLESFGTILFKKRVELVTKISIATDEILNMQEELKIDFSCTANQEVIYAEIDEDKFMQIINNLITNSLKFTPDGGKIEVHLEEKDTEVIITVRDNGIGIPQKYHATLFDKFTNARRSGLKGEISTGLGMSIIKTIVEWHDGRIWFESEENKGTTFYIHLPKQQIS